MMHLCVNKLDHGVASYNGLVPSHYPNQCWLFASRIIGKKFQWNFNQNRTIFIQENDFENVVYQMAAILSWP